MNQQIWKFDKNHPIWKHFIYEKLNKKQIYKKYQEVSRLIR